MNRTSTTTTDACDPEQASSHLVTISAWKLEGLQIELHSLKAHFSKGVDNGFISLPKWRYDLLLVQMVALREELHQCQKEKNELQNQVKKKK